MTWVLVGVVVVLLVMIGLLVARQHRSRRLKSDFGPEYGRVVSQHGDRRSAERELAARRQRFEQFEIRRLDPAARERYVESWTGVQRSFVDEPGAAVVEADLLVQQVMHDRGYPVETEFEQRAADISVEHPGVVENYRAAHALSIRTHEGNADTEHLRQAMVHFRALFADLLELRDTDDRTDIGDQSDPRMAPDQRDAGTAPTQREAGTNPNERYSGTTPAQSDPGTTPNQTTTRG